MSHLCSLHNCSILLPYNCHHHNIHLCSSLETCRKKSNTWLGQPQSCSHYFRIYRCPNNSSPRRTRECIDHVCCRYRKHQKLCYRLWEKIKREKRKKKKKKGWVYITRQTIRATLLNISPAQSSYLQHVVSVQSSLQYPPLFAFPPVQATVEHFVGVASDLQPLFSYSPLSQQ